MRQSIAVLIPLAGEKGSGKATLVSIEDEEAAVASSWHLDGYGYAGNRRAPVHRLHRLVVSRMLGRDLEPDEEIDHFNHNKLDNRRENLRLVSSALNKMNRHRFPGGASLYRGVCWYKRDSRWRAYFSHDGKQRHLGYFHDEQGGPPAPTTVPSTRLGASAAGSISLTNSAKL